MILRCMGVMLDVLSKRPNQVSLADAQAVRFEVVAPARAWPPLQ
jgi:hypothetical protein